MARRPPGSEPLPDWFLERIIIDGIQPPILEALKDPPTDTSRFPWQGTDNNNQLRQQLVEAERRLRQSNPTPALPPNVRDNAASFDAVNERDINNFQQIRHHLWSPDQSPKTGNTDGPSGNGGGANTGQQRRRRQRPRLPWPRPRPRRPQRQLQLRPQLTRSQRLHLR